MRIIGLLLCVLLLSGCGPQPAQQPKPPLPVWVALTGSSMLPEYAETGYVEVDVHFPYAKLAVGDDVMLWDIGRDGGAKRTFHRLIEQRGDGWVTQGLNRKTNPKPDALLMTEALYEGRGTGRRSVILMPPPKDSP